LINLGEQGREKLLDDVSSEASQAFEAGTLTFGRFCSGWIAEAMERWFHRQDLRVIVDSGFKAKLTSLKDTVKAKISGPKPAASSGADGFVSDEGRSAFDRNAKNIRIRGQEVNPSAPSWWEREGFLTEEGAASFKKAQSNGQIRIFERRG